DGVANGVWALVSIKKISGLSSNGRSSNVTTQGTSTFTVACPRTMMSFPLLLSSTSSTPSSPRGTASMPSKTLASQAGGIGQFTVFAPRSRSAILTTNVGFATVMAIYHPAHSRVRAGNDSRLCFGALARFGRLATNHDLLDLRRVHGT